MVASPTRPSPVNPDPDLRRTPTGRPLSQRRGLPGARAVIGGLLVVIAVVGIFLAYERATAAHASSYVVATHAIRPGDHIRASDLTSRPINLPASLRGRAFASAAAVKGAVALGPIGAGELVQRSLVTASPSDPTRNLVSFAVNRDHAVAGHLGPGDRIAVLVGTGGQAPKVVASDLQVVDIETTGGSLAGGTQLVITVSADPNQAVAVAAATNPDDVTVVRTTGVAPADQPSVDAVPSDLSGTG